MIGVPVKASVLDGVDSLYSIVQMPRGIPVATIGINNATNAALLAVRILGTSIPSFATATLAYSHTLESEVLAQSGKTRCSGLGSIRRWAQEVVACIVRLLSAASHDRATLLLAALGQIVLLHRLHLELPVEGLHALG